jgi:hypothetical protein
MKETTLIEIPPLMFQLGRLRQTPRVSSVLKQTGVSAWTLLFAHGSGRWVAEEDREQFDHAVENNFEIVSHHFLANGARIAVRTVEGHTETVVMLAVEMP